MFNIKCLYKFFNIPQNIFFQDAFAYFDKGNCGIISTKVKSSAFSYNFFKLKYKFFKFIRNIRISQV